MDSRRGLARRGRGKGLRGAGLALPEGGPDSPLVEGGGRSVVVHHTLTLRKLELPQSVHLKEEIHCLII